MKRQPDLLDDFVKQLKRMRFELMNSDITPEEFEKKYWQEFECIKALEGYLEADKAKEQRRSHLKIVE